jgi:hypothetical protein
MPEVDDLLTTFLPRLVTAERALRDGDPSARPVIWSHVPPVTFFGAAAGAEPQCYALRVTTILRREEGDWKVVHRHGDPKPDSASAREQVVRMQQRLR